MILIDYSKIFHSYKILKEAFTNIKSAKGRSAIINMKHLYDNLKQYNENDEKNTLKDITDYILYMLKLIKPESIGYIKRFKQTGRKILFVKGIDETSFVSYTEEKDSLGEIYPKDIIINIRLLGNLEHFDHEFIHLMQHIELASKYSVGKKFKFTFGKEKKDNTPQDVVNYMLDPFELEKDLSLYISTMQNKRYTATGNYRGILKKIFEETLKNYSHWYNKILQILLNKPSLKIKILKRLVREGIKYKES
jgi:hypothetical protein